MLNRTLTIVIVAVILVFAAAVIASSMSGEQPQTHTMPSGERMDGSEMGR
jgi:hypothetical protein